MRTYSKILLALLLSATAVVQTAQAMPTPDDNSTDDRPPRNERPKFSTIDINSDGEIDSEEFSAQKLPHGDHQTVFASMDTDNNGVISEEEFENHKPPHKKNRG